jgi:16S rRNA (cytidine1402-2'-O)-methyltransferase
VAGKLFIVGTPIGNLGDITLRAIETLRAVSIVAAEDTRRTRGLLSHLQITDKRVVCIDAHASEAAIERLLDHVIEGQSVAVVTDAGMPAISDPGSAVAGAAHRRGIVPTVIPGPSAVTMAIAASGLVEGPYVFLGFLPRNGSKRDDAIARIATTELPVLVFEAPNRTATTLTDLARVMPARQGCLCRELTKLHEEVIVDSLTGLAERSRDWRGEVVLVLGPAEPAPAEPPDEAAIDALIVERLARGMSTKDVASALSAELGLPRRELYSRVQALRTLSNSDAKPKL